MLRDVSSKFRRRVKEVPICILLICMYSAFACTPHLHVLRICMYSAFACTPHLHVLLIGRLKSPFVRTPPSLVHPSHWYTPLIHTALHLCTLLNRRPHSPFAGTSQPFEPTPLVTWLPIRRYSPSQIEELAPLRPVNPPNKPRYYSPTEGIISYRNLSCLMTLCCNCILD